MDPSDSKQENVSRLLSEASTGSEKAASELLPVVYRELHALASRRMASERLEHTLQATALVHEAYIKLVDDKATTWEDRAHFIGIASRAMRQILVDHARRRNAAKRGGDRKRLSLHSSAAMMEKDPIDVVALDDALTRLSQLDDRQSRLVELRFFGGLTAQEATKVLGVSLSTVESDWRMAKSWLYRELHGHEGGTSH